MCKKWLLYIAAIIVFISVTFAIFFYWDIGKDNRWSTFFSFTSTYGIIATIGVYLWQKNDTNEDKIVRHNLIKLELNSDCEYYERITNDINTFSDEINQYEGNKGKKLDKINLKASGQYINLLAITESKEIISWLVINQNRVSMLNLIAYNTNFLDEKTYNALLLIGEIKNTIDTYININIINNALNDKKDSRAKIDVLKGYSTVRQGGFKSHRLIIDKLKIAISSIE